MKTAIVYYSEHHGNTQKLLDAIAAKHDVDLVNITATPAADLSGYDRIGLASGIYYGTFAKPLLAWAEKHLPEGKDRQKNGREIGEYHCQGFDTFGPFKLVGGIAKGHPTAEETAGAVSFYESL